MTPIKIDVKNGVVTCGANGGHVRVCHGTKITWTSDGDDKKFKLEFFPMELESGTPSPLEHWPFKESADSQPSPANTFVATLRDVGDSDHVPVYKYNVRVGDLLLDPILIIDRK